MAKRLTRRQRAARQYWDVVRVLEIQYGLPVREARRAYQDVRDLVGASPDLASFGEIPDVFEAAAAFHRPGKRRAKASPDLPVRRRKLPPVVEPEPVRPVEYVVTAKYGKRGHAVTVDVRLRYRDGQKAEGNAALRAVRYFSKHEEWPDGWAMELIRWKTPRGYDREGSESDVGAFAGLFVPGPVTELTVGEERI